MGKLNAETIDIINQAGYAANIMQYGNGSSCEKCSLYVDNGKTCICDSLGVLYDSYYFTKIESAEHANNNDLYVLVQMIRSHG